MNASSSGSLSGVLLDEKYRVDQEIGRGGMATIFAAENVDIGKRVAVKVLAEELTHSKTVNERFLREARAAAKIQSPYICDVYDVGTYKERPFIVMELLKGESLYERLSRERQLSQQETLRITRQVAKGLAKAHASSIIHRDLKPENIFLCTREEGDTICKIVDFGLAKFYEPNLDSASARLTKEGALFGTPAYMSPEQASGQGNVDLRSDLWALGCIVFEMLTGRTVWNVDQGVPMILAQVGTALLPEIRKYRPDLPLTFDAWFHKALARDPADRYQDSRSFIVALDQTLAPGSSAGLAATADRSTPFDPPGATDHQSNPFESRRSLPPPPGAALAATHTPKPSRAKWVAAASLLIVVAGAVSLWLTGGIGMGLGRPAPAGPPVENVKYAGPVAEAQAMLAKGSRQDAHTTLQQTLKESKGKAARSLLGHVTTSLEPATLGQCELSAIGHPRPFEHHSASSEPALLSMPNGLLVAWSDSDLSNKRSQIHTALMDSSLRRVSDPINVTPEASEARSPYLTQLNNGLGLLYWDIQGKQPGVYSRTLTPSGHIKSARRLLSKSYDTHPFYPTLTPDGGDGYFLVWVEPTRERVHDLLVRRLDAELNPVGAAKTLTGYPTPSGKHKTQAARPSIAFFGGLLHTAFTLRRSGSQQLLLIRTSPQAIDSALSAVPAPSEQAPSASEEEYDRFLGQVLTLSEQAGQHDRPQIKCSNKACLIAWDEALGAARLAEVDLRGTIVWRRRFVEKGARPGLGLLDGSWLASWFQDKRLFVSPLTRGTATGPSAVGRVSAILKQPSSTIIPATSAGQWFVGWRGYEAGSEEPFVAKVTCQK